MAGQATHVLSSSVGWCGARFELDTKRPHGRSYRLHCPACKHHHEFTVKSQ